MSIHSSSDALALQAMPFAQNAVSSSHTGDTTETALATITIPAGTIGANGQVEVIALWSVTNNANSKTLKVKLGATAFTSVSTTSTGSFQTYTRIANRNSQASQVAMAFGAGNAFASSGGANTTAAIDTSVDTTLTLTGTLAVGTDTVTLESYIVHIYRMQ